MENKTTEFILKAKKLHGDMYDYSNVIYIDAHKKVVIVCRTHGKFEQSPNGHLVKDKKNGGGRGCVKCGRIKGALKTRKNTDQFIIDAQKIHGNKYNYSKVDYKTSKENVTIICPKDDHGPFQQQPLNHLGGKGCSKCSGVYKPNTDEFIQKAKEIHGENTYDYSLVNYVDCKTHVVIICPKEGHGPFEQAPSNHYIHGCSKCGYKRLSEYKTSTTDEFIQKAKEIHGDTYDYSMVDYKDSQTKVTIVCKIIGHGPFEQAPNSHIQGAGCAKCSGVYKHNTDEFIQKAKEKHGDIYDYSMVDYTGCKDYVTIICPKEGHGAFQQTPDSHINNKAGCQICSNQRTALRMSDTQEDFLRKAVEVHGNKFDYSKVHYIDSQTYVTIICQEEGHGEFPQVPSSHLQGTGCIKCSGTYQSNTDEFIQKAKKIHGEDTYDYSKVDYINCHTSVIIGCREHGNFEQAASGHLSGKGCYICGGHAPLTLEIAIKRFQEKHGDKYDYSKCEYVNCSTNMTIICRKHGEFQQAYDNHSRGQGCPSCVWKTEGKLYDTLKSKYPTIQRQFKADWCKNKTYLPFDLCIEEDKTIIELDGGQHFIQVSNWSSPEHQFQNDIYKQNCANENGYSVIRLLQEDVLYDRYDWCKKIDDAIEEIKNSDEPKNIYLCENNEYYRYK